MRASTLVQMLDISLSNNLSYTPIQFGAELKTNENFYLVFHFEVLHEYEYITSYFKKKILNFIWQPF